MTVSHSASPPDPMLLLHAHLDGELDPANALEMERRIAADPALAAERERIEALRQVMREHLSPETLPPGLRARVEAAVGSRPAAPRQSWRSLAASIAITAVVASSSTWLLLRQQPTVAAADAVVASHIRALMAPQPTDVTSSERHTVKPWFSGRIPQAPRVINLANAGFPLAGGRVDVIGQTPVATLVYRRRQHVVSLVAVPAPGKTSAAESADSLHGYNVITWSDPGVAYWAVSDLNGKELAEFTNLFRTAPADQ